MKSWPLRLFGVGIVTFIPAPAVLSAQDVSPPVVEQTAASSADIDALIRQLGDPDFRKRDDAVGKLKEAGAAALPALKAARQVIDPEVAGRADGVIRFIEQPPVPGGLPNAPGGQWRGRMGGNVNLRMNVKDGVHRVEVREQGGRVIGIEEGPNGIRMSVTGMENGKQVTRDFQARTPEQLKQQNPDAFELYSRWTGRAGGVRGRRGAAPFGLRVVPNPPLGRPVGPPDANELLERLRQQQRQLAQQQPARGNDPLGAHDAVHEEMLDALHDLDRRLRADEVGDDPVKIHDPAGAAKAGPQLGILVQENAGNGVTVARVMPGSRAEAMGLQSLDVIESVNGTPVSEASELQRTLAAIEAPLVVEGTRDKKPFKLEEKRAGNTDLKN